MRADRLHAAARRGARTSCGSSKGLDGRVPMRSELVIRFDYGRIVPWVRRVDDAPRRDRRPRRALLPDPGRGARRGADDGLRVHARGGRAGPVRAHVVPVARRSCPRRSTPSSALDRDRGLLARLGRRSAGTDGDYHEEIHQSLLVLKALTYAPDRRDRGGADHLAARADRRRAQLGLPLLLAARRDADAARDAERRLQRRGGGLARLAAARGRGRPGRPPDHVRARAASGGSTSASSTGSRATRVEAGAGRQRRVASSSSSTSTARCSTRSTRRARTACRRTTTPGR